MKLIFLVITLISFPSFSSELNLPPLLKKIVAASLQKNEANLIKNEELLQAKEQKSQATGTLLPSLQFLGTALIQEKTDIQTIANLNSNTQTTARLNLKQNLFRGGSEYALYRKADHLISQKTNEVNAAEQKVLFEITEKVLRIFQSEKESDRLKAEIALYDDQIKELKRRVSIGRSKESDLLNLEATRATYFSKKIAEDISRKNNIQELELISGLTLSGTSFKNEVFTFPKLASLSTYETESGKNSDFIVAQSRVHTVEEDISAMRGQHLPQLDIGGNYWFKRQGSLNQNIDWDLSLNLMLPLFSGGVIQSQVREAASRYKVAQLEESRIDRENKTQIKSLYYQLTEGESQIDALKNVVLLTKKTKDRIQSDYRLSLVTLLDVLTATRNYSDAERSYDELSTSLILSRLKLDLITQNL